MNFFLEIFFDLTIFSLSVNLSLFISTAKSFSNFSLFIFSSELNIILFFLFFILLLLILAFTILFFSISFLYPLSKLLIFLILFILSFSFISFLNSSLIKSLVFIFSFSFSLLILFSAFLLFATLSNSFLLLLPVKENFPLNFLYIFLDKSFFTFFSFFSFSSFSDFFSFMHIASFSLICICLFVMKLKSFLFSFISSFFANNVEFDSVISTETDLPLAFLIIF